jgi:glycosyltransferase involved in cell wall biosynthesis
MKVMIYAEVNSLTTKGGAERYIKILVEGLIKSGIDVYLVTPFRILNKNALIGYLKFNLISLTNSIKIGKVIVNFFNLIQTIKRINPDIIHISGMPFNQVFILIYAKYKKIPCINTYHGENITKLGSFYNKITTFLFFNLYEKILAQTDREYEKLLKRKVKSDKLLLFRFIGVDVKKFACNDIKKRNYKQILFVGRLDENHPYKGLELLLYAIKKYNETFTDNISLKVVGGGNLKNYYEGIAHYLKIDASFLGDVSEEMLIELYCTSGLFVLPSNSEGEGFGTVVLEAISTGVPVIVSKYAGISELILKYDAGLVVDPYNVEDFAKKLNLLIYNEKLKEKYISNAYRMIKIEKLIWEDIINKTIDIYKEILSQARYERKYY